MKEKKIKTSFCFYDITAEQLKELAEHENRNNTNMIETLVARAYHKMKEDQRKLNPFD
jgi:hypothetical protein